MEVYYAAKGAYNIYKGTQKFYRDVMAYGRKPTRRKRFTKRYGTKRKKSTKPRSRYSRTYKKKISRRRMPLPRDLFPKTFSQTFTTCKIVLTIPTTNDGYFAYITGLAKYIFHYGIWFNNEQPGIAVGPAFQDKPAMWNIYLSVYGQASVIGAKVSMEILNLTNQDLVVYFRLDGNAVWGQAN